MNRLPHITAWSLGVAVEQKTERTRSSLRAGYLETTANPIGHSGGNGQHSTVRLRSNGRVGDNKISFANGKDEATGWRVAAAAMGIDWMRRSELTQAIPPVMTEYLASWSPAILEAA